MRISIHPPNHISRRGFTIVELLIVIVVIGILAAITIVAYNGIQERARVSAASAALNQASKKILVAMNDGTLSSYPANQAAFDALGITSSNVTYQYSLTGGGSGYCITATTGSTSYKITESTSPTANGCAGHGQGGVAAITNLSTNPSAETSLASYSGPNGATLSQTSLRSKNGSSSILVTMPTQGSSYTGINTTLGYTIPTNFKANTTYMFSAWVYVPAATVNVHMSTQGNGVGSSSCGASSNTSVKNTWVRLSCPFTTAASGSFALYVLNSAAATAGMQLYVDSVMFTEGTTLHNYADGSFANWVWDGVANTSTSTGPPA